MREAPRISSYEWAGGREAMLRFGPDDGPVVVVALPLFEEANRTRAFAGSICRALAVLGIGSVLADLPGQGESVVPTVAMTLPGLRAAFAAVPGSHAMAIRSGALLVDKRPAWLLAPQDSSALLRELARIKGGPLTGEGVEVAGNLLSAAFLADLGRTPHPGEGRGPVAVNNERLPDLPSASQLGPGLRRGGARVVRLTSDNQAADRHVDGPALWRRSEPDNDLAFAEMLGADIAAWIAACAG